MDKPIHAQTTQGFYVQAIISFAVSSVAVTIGVLWLPLRIESRAFLLLGLLYVITSAFTLAKCVRDRQEVSTVTGRVDQARLDKLLAEHDPFKTESV